MKTRMSVLLASLLAIALLAGMATFAGAEADKPFAGTKIRFSSYQTGPVEEDWISVQFPRFLEETGIEVEHVYIAHTDTISTLMTWSAAGLAPDCSMLSANYANSLASNDLLIDLDAYVAEKRPDYDLTRFFPKLMNAYKYQGVQYALPSDMDLGLTWYNKDMFDTAGVAYPAANWTWDEYKAAAQALTQGEGPEKVFGTEIPPIQHLLWQAGADYLSEDGTACTINTPAAKSAYQLVLDLINGGYAPRPGSEGVGLSSGRAAIAMGNGPWYAFYVLNDVEFAWDVAPMPQNAEKATTAYGSSFGILKSSANVDAAFEFIAWFLSDEQQFIRADKFSWFPPASTVLEYPGFNEDSVLNMTAAQKALVLAEAEYGRAPVVVARQSEVRQIIDREESLIWSGEKSIDDALATMEQEISPLLLP
ncbi:MAG: sugar ABC transporter substrate-binding protein [Clostridiales bacterium]|nr:sugar ABC transporter substrate-binding protein [Clostridiales bacterium]